VEVVVDERVPPWEVPYGERTPEERRRAAVHLALKTRCYSAIVPYERFKCYGCGRMFDGKEKRRQVVFHFVDMCPGCAVRGGVGMEAEE
jgi:hypothetical protein